MTRLVFIQFFPEIKNRQVIITLTHQNCANIQQLVKITKNIKP